MAAIVDEEKCTGCASCVEVCPVGAISVNSVAHVDTNTCVDCGTCVDECPHGVISIE
ncbi:4Fe-4S binding protein [Thermincola potens]|uniref:4Fe-4S ferredoxin iron-sulfur binding domain protein n=1 Tax=Thermincola potens (strain JR) TaxID=635013 RepID=D5XEN8_THEPJ|nr:4Fe-4S binding protein [Thermincola potens]ADG82109.1 4Fe-4S ferredoxin iron-sulfur binding domain protein [Thermincola potens JR]